MPKFAANLSMMFNEVIFRDRFDAAAQAGFEAVEFLFPYEWPESDVKRWLNRSNLTCALFNLPPGDWDAGDRGMAAIPGREAEFEKTVEKAIPYTRALGVKHVHAMAGITTGMDEGRCAAVFKANLRRAANVVALEGLDLLLEPINTRDMPGYFLNRVDDAIRFIDDIGAFNIRLQFDIYHRQIMGGDIIRTLQRALPYIGHIQIASVPNRHEPDEGELNYAEIFAALDDMGYEGYVGCEYRPRGETAEGLGWLTALVPERPAPAAPEAAETGSGPEENSDG